MGQLHVVDAHPVCAVLVDDHAVVPASAVFFFLDGGVIVDEDGTHWVSINDM